MATVPNTAPERLGSLDGLRGVAALVVVFHHLSLVSPLFADLYLSPEYQEPAIGSGTWWLTATPLQALLAGQEAVVVFFVLSGLVVALPAVSREGFDWMAYYPRRVVRLYLPAVASVLLAAALILIHPQWQSNVTSLWTALYSRETTTWELVVNNFDLLFGDNSLNNPLWSLRWEVLFSLALPLFVLLAFALRRRIWLAAVVAWALSWLGLHLNNDCIRFLPVFFLGTLVAVRLPDLLAWASRNSGSRRWSAAWAAATAGAVVLLSLSWIVRSASPDNADLIDWAKSLTGPAALVLVMSAAVWRPARAALTVAPARWLGRISFSLYLVHVPVILTVANILGHRSILATVVVSFAVSLGLAELFSRFVEQPAHRLARRVGAWASAVAARVADQASATGR
jgi:peptidoglycan/LPS O-acetylase OafA/YrhL